MAVFVVLAGAVVRALYEIMSFGSGGEKRVDRPGIIILHPWIADIATLALAIALAVVGYIGFETYRWVGVFVVLAATLLIGSPLATALLKLRENQLSIYYSSPFLQLIVLLPAVIAFVLFAW